MMKPFNTTTRKIPHALHGPPNNSFNGMNIRVHVIVSQYVYFVPNRLKKTYLKYARELQGTGEGVKRTDGDYANLIGESTLQS